MANYFPFRTKPQLYDSTILPGYWQRHLDWRRRSRSFACHRRGRPVTTTLSFWRTCRDLYQTFFRSKPMIALLIAPMFAAAGYSLIYLLLGGSWPFSFSLWRKSWVNEFPAKSLDNSAHIHGLSESGNGSAHYHENANWTGVPLAAVLEHTGLKATAAEVIWSITACPP